MPFSKEAQERLLSLFQNHTRSLGYALAAVIDAQPKDIGELRSTLQAAMEMTYLTLETEGELDLKEAATSPFQWLIDGVEDFAGDSQELGSAG